MSFKDLKIKISYISYGDDNMSKSFLIPALRETKLYQRSVGFFSSSAFEPIIDGIVALKRNGGKIQLIASPKLSEDDINAISSGYDKRENVVMDSFTSTFVSEIEEFDDFKLKLLVELIASGTLDIKIAVTKNTGIYHDKLGIMEDFDGNVVVFNGSSNSSANGYQYNYEKIRVRKSWETFDLEGIEDEKSEFISLWNNTNPFVEVFEYKESAKANILKIIAERESNNVKDEPIQLRDYQNEAIQAWIDNDYHGFYVMATGTGKTWTAIYSAKKLLELHSAMIVICAPYKHLLEQWKEDVEKVFSTAKIILVSSENKDWHIQIKNEIIGKKYRPEKQIIIISTIASFKMERFMKLMDDSEEEKLLIVDEAHRFTNRSEEIKNTFSYMLGLSATPYGGRSSASGNELMNYFGGRVFDLPIEKALELGYLVPYNYYPIVVSATEEEEIRFNRLTTQIMGYFQKTNRDYQKIAELTRARLRIISMAEEKQNHIDEIINGIYEKDHFIIYCGDGKLINDGTGEELKHIQSVKRDLSNHGFKASQFTASENIKERMQLVENFNNGYISALAAIKCLDEGINIPSIKGALILSSNDSYREFVQRRGRILRQYKGKQEANIYDVIVLPSQGLKNWAKIELRRFYEYARLAINADELNERLSELLDWYFLQKDDIDIFNYDELEEDMDE